MVDENVVQKMEEETDNKLMERTILDSFQQLTSDSEKIRVNASILILKHLNTIETTSEDQNEFNYALNRLIRGVSASRNNAKFGFYSTLVALLLKSPITTQNVLDAVSKQLNPTGSNLKSENADIAMGQILVCSALIHSEMFFKSTREEQIKIVEILINASKQRSYLSLAACVIIVELVEKCTEEQFQNIWEVIKQEISNPWEKQTLDSIYILLKVKYKFPNLLKSKYISKLLDYSDIVNKDSLKHLSIILLNIPSIAYSKHPVYSEIAKSVVEKSLVENFCLELDNFLQTPNRNKQIIITNLLTMILENLEDSSVIPQILTNNYVKCTIHNFKYRPTVKDEQFYIKMDLFFQVLLKKLTNDVDSKIKIDVIKKFLFYPGIFIFEKITKSKLIQQIANGLDDKGVKKLYKLYKNVVLATKPKVVNKSELENWINNDRIYASQLMVKLLTHHSVQNDVDWRLEQLKFFFTLAICKESEDVKIGIEIANALKDCFYHALDQKLPKLEDLRSVLSSLIHFINKLVFEDEQELRTPLTEEIITNWKEMLKFLSKLEGNFEHTFAIPVFHTLVLHMGLQFFNDAELAQNSLKELYSCFNKLEVESPKKRKMKEGELEKEEPIWIEVVVDLFLNLLSHNSHLMRSIINCVFCYLCPHLTLTALRQILDVLDPKNESNPLAKDGESESSDEENDSSDEDSEESENSEVDQTDYEESATDKMRIAVRQALHKSGYRTDDESEDMDDMDEEQGKKLDKALAEAFSMVKKTSKGKKTKQNKDDKLLTHFRVRALDLIDIYLNSEPAMINCFEIACLLLQTLEFSIRNVHQSSLEQRIRSTLKKLSSIKKFSSFEDTTEEIIATMLKSFLDKGSRNAFIFQCMGDTISDCCIFAIHCSQIISSNNSKKSKTKQDEIAQIFKESLELFFQKRGSLLPPFLFKNILQLNWQGIWSLIPQLVHFAFDDNIRPFRRNQALELLKTFYCNKRFRTSNLGMYKSFITPLEEEISNNTIKVLNRSSLNSTDSKIKERFVNSLLQLLIEIKMENGEKMDWIKIGNAIQNYKSQVSLAKNLKTSYKKLCRMLEITDVETKLNKTENGHEIVELDTSQIQEEKLNKKRKKNKFLSKDKQKAKKEARLLRMQASSEGLTDFIAFSSIPLSNVANKEIEQENEKKQSSKLNGDINNDDKIESKLNGNIDKSKKSKKRCRLESDDRPKKKKQKNNV